MPALSIMSVISFVNEREYTASEVYDLCAAVTAAGGTMPFRAAGTSMSPALPDGTVVRLGPVPRRPPLGAVVLASLGQRTVLHRVLWRRRGQVLLAGDANPRLDGWVACEQLAGVVVEWSAGPRQRRATWWRRWLAVIAVIVRRGGRWFLSRR
jgi:hypothetical protein